MRYKIYQGMPKQASPNDELFAKMLYGGALDQHGGFKGYMEPVITDKELEKMDADESTDWAPGIGAYRLQRRMKKTLANDNGKVPHYWSQNWAPAVHSLIGMTAGAGIGASVSDNKGLGAILGMYGGAVAPLLASALMGLGAAVTPRWSKEEQKRYNNSSTAAEWIVPGLSTYNNWKTFGRAKGNFEEAKAKREAKKEKKEDKGEKKEASIQKLAYAAMGQGYTPQYQQYDIGPGYMNVQGGVAPTGSTYQPQYAYANSGYNANGQRYVAYGNVPSAQYAPPRNVRQPQPQMTPPPQGMPQQPRMRPNSPYMGVNAQGIPTVTAGNVPGYQNKAPRVMGGAFAQQQRPAMAAPQPPVQRGMRPNSPYISNNNGVRTVTAGNVPGFQNKTPRNIGGRGVR